MHKKVVSVFKRYSLILVLLTSLSVKSQILSTYAGVYARVPSAGATTTIPNIISDNLALHYDAANTNSYPRTGATWKDLKGTADATLKNSPTYSSSYGGIITFDGVNERAISNSVSLSYATGFTVEVMVKFNSVSGNQALVSFNNQSSAKFINLWKANGAGMRWEIGQSQSITGTNNLIAGVWYHFTGVYDGTTAKLYRNGVLEASGTFSSSNTSATAPYVMGDYDDLGSFPLNGSIAISRLYTRALSASEVLQNYNATKMRFAEIVSSGLMMNLAVAPPSGSSWSDISGNGNHATINGTNSYFGEYGGSITTSAPSYSATGYIKTSYNLGNSFTLSMACSLNPSSYWATMWGNESWYTSKGYLAYLPYGGSLAIGSPSGTASYTAAGIGSLSLWDFVVNGTSLIIYKNGTSVYTGTFTAPSGGLSTSGLYFGARHLNDGSSYADPCPGTYYSMRIYNRALTSTEVATNFSVLRGIYGL